MFIIKKKYYLYIENTNDINLKNIKKSKKIIIIYRNNNKQENTEIIRKFKKNCNRKNFKFYIANNIQLLKACGGDGLYLSSFNKKIYLNKKINLIGSAHCFKEINEKIKQGCKTILLSRLFKTDYENKKSFLGLVKFNLIIKNYKVVIIPLGGIKSSNLNKLNLVNSIGLALLSEIKKKPVISNRLF
jgi:thiamine monophosphate synthase